MDEEYGEYFKAGVIALVKEVGFEDSENEPLDVLTELFSSVFIELGKKTVAMAEHCGRSQPLGAADLLVATANMGLCIDNLRQYAFRLNRPILSAPVPQAAPKQQPLLQIGRRQQHPLYFSSHLPPFPEVHTYMRKPVTKKLCSDYEKAREKAAADKRYMEESYNKFLTDDRPTESLFFNQENDCFPLIAVTPFFPPYMKALIPTDQSFEHIYGEAEKTSTTDIDQSLKKDKDDKDDSEEMEYMKADLESLMDNPYVKAGTSMMRSKSTSS